MKANDRVRAVQERRRSNAAGPHGGRRNRTADFASELADQLDDWVAEDEAAEDEEADR